MKLSIKDYYIIAELMQRGNLYVEFLKGSETLFVYFSVETSNRREASTGGWITTSAIVTINDIECYDEDGVHTICDVDENNLIEICESYLLTT